MSQGDGPGDPGHPDDRRHRGEPGRPDPDDPFGRHDPAAFDDPPGSGDEPASDDQPGPGESLGFGDEPGFEDSSRFGDQPGSGESSGPEDSSGFGDRPRRGVRGLGGGGDGSPGAPGRRPAPPASRLATIAVVVAVIALSAFVDHSSKSARSSNSPTAASTGAGSTAMPMSAPARALSSSWFCAGPAAAPAHLAEGRLVIANAGSRPLAGKVSFIPSSGSSITQNLRVGRGQRVVVPEPSANGAPYLGAVVNLDGGQAAVQQVVSGSEGTSSTACSTAGSTSWYFPAGTTQENSTMSISLLNPFPDDAIADLSFTTEQGQENPEDFQGIVIPAGTLVGLDLGSHLRDRASVATTVTLRVGRVAAFETETVQPQTSAQKAVAAPGSVPWPPGVAVSLGTPSPGTSWWWPSGAAASGETEQYVMYNPTANEAQLSLGLVLDQGSADPFQISVDPFSVTVVTSNTESRIPLGIGHGAWLHSTNGVGVVAERLVMATTPSPQTGVAEVLGSRLQASRWLVPGDGTTETVNPTLAVYNPGSTSVMVTISSLGSSGGGRAVVIPSQSRYVLAPSSAGAELITCQGGGQVVVEGDVTPAHGIGLDSAIGVPLG